MKSILPDVLIVSVSGSGIGGTSRRAGINANVYVWSWFRTYSFVVSEQKNPLVGAKLSAGISVRPDGLRWPRLQKLAKKRGGIWKSGSNTLIN